MDAGFYHQIAGKKVLQCPSKMLADPWAQEIIRLHAWWKNGQLQLRCKNPSNKTLIALDMYGSAIAKSQESLLKQSQNQGTISGHDSFPKGM